MIEDRFRDGNAVLLFQPLSEAGDRHLLEREGDVECEMLFGCQLAMIASANLCARPALTNF